MQSGRKHTFGYDRTEVSAGIVHFGVGNFHRAHLEYYTNLLLEDASQKEWGVFGAMIMPSDKALFEALKADDGIYELSVCYPDGKQDVYEIGSLTDLAWGEQTPEKIIEKIASEQTKIITLTITEGGYSVDYDKPKTVFHYIAEGLLLRKKANLPITILSCDNLQHNGDTARKAFMGYFEKKYPELVEWVSANVTFPNSMVDRITPATKSGKITDVRCEDFIQWVVEDKFAAGRPAWEKVGVQFTDDVSPYETIKLSLLNASHSLLSYPSYLEDFRKVDDVLSDPRYRTLIKKFMDVDVTPYMPAPDGVDLEEYKETLLRRFSNAAISDQVSRLCGDGIAKFKVYIVPTLEKMIADGRNTAIEAFLIASYYKYLCGKRTESGEEIVVDEPHMEESDRQIIAEGSARHFLELSPFAQLHLERCEEFIGNYDRFCKMNVSDAIKMI